MARPVSTPVKNLSDQPVTTLQFIDNDDPYIKSLTETSAFKKPEKSVHFEDDSILSSDQSVESLNDSPVLLSWIPSEHLYSDDTFITETHAETTGKETSGPSSTPYTAVSYGSSTFIEESEDETKTESEYSLTAESISSADVFSSRTGSETYREWKDVTEIVKDIEELAESDMTRADFHSTQADDSDLTSEGFTDSLEEEMGQEARNNFLIATLRRLHLANTHSPRSLESEPIAHREAYSANFVKKRKSSSKEETSFCRKMIERCKKKSEIKLTSPAQTAHQEPKKYLEHYGLNSALVNRIKVENLCQRLQKKCEKLDQETEESLKFLESKEDIETEIAKQKFISRAKCQIQQNNTEERIQAHLIRMHPVKCFADFVVELPRWNEDSREILYKYKRILEKRREEEEAKEE